MSASTPARGTAQLLVLCLLLLTVPLGLRALNAAFAGDRVPDSYLPALEGPRRRGAFEPTPREQLADMKPGYVVIGDSMAGTRIHTTHLTELTGQPAAPILQAGSGPVYWYLALKNWVIASGARPRVAFIFFRDTNLTDVMYRLDEGYRWNVDRVALDREEEVNAVIASRVGEWRHRLLAMTDAAYESDRARLWMAPGLGDQVSRGLIPSRRQRREFTAQMNARFDFTHMRPFEAADLIATVDREADFDFYVARSVLPLMLRDARQAGITLCFVRVQRRPIGGRPPEQSAALRRYVERLRAYVEANGGIFHDDTGDPNLPLEMYDDGDHVKMEWTARYTENLYTRVRGRLR